MNIFTSVFSCQAGMGRADLSSRCMWRKCDEPYFTTKEKLLQHMLLKHVSDKLICPYGCQYFYLLMKLVTNRLS